MTTQEHSRDSRTLALSVVASSVFAVGSLVWGLLAGSQTIVFDGRYSFVSVALSLLAVVALRAARHGPDERYPWGREVFEPLTITVKAAALAGLCGYAVIGGIEEIVAGPLMRRYSKALEYDYSPSLRADLLADAAVAEAFLGGRRKA